MDENCRYWYIQVYVLDIQVYTSIYQYIQYKYWIYQYQHYETLLKEINSHPGLEEVPPDQYEVETVALADSNFNVPCESGIRYPSLIAMLNRLDMRWIPSVRPNAIFSSKNVYKLSYTVLTVSYNSSYLYIHCFHLKCVCSIGRQSLFKWQCSS